MSYTNGLDKPTDYFNTVTYSGTGSNQSITGVGFQPDLIWGKGRTLAGYDHRLADIVRGNTKLLKSNSTDAEETQTTEIQSFDSDGFTVGTGNRFNNSSQTYVAWNWLADNTSGSSNTDGSITSSVSANQDAGFSIVSYTGTGSNATVGHGLGTTPAWVLVKERGASGESWNNFHQSLGAGITIMLNLTNAQQSSSTMWNNTAPTSSVFSVGADAGSNGSSKTYIAYCFAEKKGYSKFGSYTGNNLDDGTFCYTGMKPSFVMIKRTDSTSEWNIYDVKRNPFNLTNLELEANTSDAEANVSEREIDILSNGFKLRGRSTFINAPGGSYIYMAFAENPFVTSTGIPSCAR